MGKAKPRAAKPGPGKQPVASPQVVVPQVQTKSAYEFNAEELDVETVAACVKKLKGAGSKEQVLKALKQLAELLEAAPQDATPFGNLGPNLAKNLLHVGSPEDADKDVKLYAAVCSIHLLRIFAPETPFDDAQLREVFRLFIWALERLSQTSLPTFPILCSLLQVAAETKLYLLMMDVDESDLTEALVVTLIKAVRDDNLEAIQVSAQQVVCGVLEEAGTDGLSDTIITCLLRSLAGVPPGGAGGQKLAGLVVTASDKLLRPALQKVVLQLLEGQVKDAALKQHAAELLAYLLSVAPDVLLPVLPALKVELDALEEERRAAAARLVTHLMCSHQATLFADKYFDVARLFLDRYRDVSPDVRLLMLNATKSLLASSIAPIQEQALQQSCERLTDPEDAVRLTAVKVLCEVGSSHLEVLPHEVITGLLARLLDTKLVVRKEAATGLVGVFRHMATCVAQVGAVPDTLDIELLSLPARLAVMTKADADTRGHVMQLLASPGLLPASGAAATPAGAATVWALVWCSCDARGQEALLRLLRTKTELSRTVAALLSVGRHMQAAKQSQQEEAAVDVEALQRRRAKLCVEVMEAVVGPGGADSHPKLSAQLESLLEFKDAKVFERLATLCQPTTSEADAKTARKDLIERVGSKSSLGHFTTLLTACLMPNLISPAALQGLAALAVPAPTSPAAVTDSGAGHQAGQQQDALLSPSPTQAELGGGKGQRNMSPAVVSAPLKVRQAAGEVLCAAAKLAPGLFIGLMSYMAKALVRLVGECNGIGANSQENGAGAAAGGKQQGKKGTGRKQHGGKQQQGVEAQQGVGSRVVDVEQVIAVLTVMANGMRSRMDAMKQGVRLDSLPSELPTCLTHLCTSGPPKAAQLAVFVLASLGAPGLTPAGGPAPAPPTAAGTDVSSWPSLEALSQQLLKSLTAGQVATPEALAAVHALSSIGCIAPALFSGYADQLVKFVIEEVLYADNPGGARDQPAALHHVKHKSYQGQQAPNGGVVAMVKAKVLKVVAKGCSPAVDAGALPEATHAAVQQLIPVLEGVADVDTNVSELGGINTDEDAACLRLAAACAILRLSVRHDMRIPASTYTTLSLVIQDPSQSVRACFSTKLALHVAKLQATCLGATNRSRRGAPDWQPSKYAAILPLAVVDPAEQLRHATCTTLRSYLLGKRAAALSAARQALASGGGEVGLLAQPEFTLPCLIYLLATHPDCPDVKIKAAGTRTTPTATDHDNDDEQDEEDEEEEEEDVCAALEPFSRMLQTLLEPLMLLAVTGSEAGVAGRAAGGRSGGGRAAHAGSAAQAAQDNYPLIRKLLTSVKSTRVMTEESFPGATHHMRTLCDVGLGLAAAIVSRECDAAGVPQPTTSRDHPAEVRLPRNLFDCTPPAAGSDEGRRVKASHLPPGYQVTLDPGVTELFSSRTHKGVPVKAGRRQAGRKRQTGSRAGGTGKRRKTAAGVDVRGAGRGRRGGKGQGAASGTDDDDEVSSDEQEEEEEGGARASRDKQVPRKQGRPVAESGDDDDGAESGGEGGRGNKQARKGTPGSGGKGRGGKGPGKLPTETPTRRMPSRAGRAANMGVDLLPDEVDEE